MATDKKEAIVFMAVVAPGPPVTFTERIKGDGTVEQLKVRFFTGQQKSLRVRPYIRHHGNKPDDLITFPEGTDQYLSGDDDYLVFDCVVPVQTDDEIVIWAQNVDPDGVDSYTLNVSMMVDYYGGTDRVV